jgi:hypothetical protein
MLLLCGGPGSATTFYETINSLQLPEIQQGAGSANEPHDAYLVADPFPHVL